MTHRPTAKGRAYGVASLRLVIAGGLLYYLSASGALRWSALLGLLKTWAPTAGALILLFLVLALMAWRLCILLRPEGFRLSFGLSLRLTLIGTFFNMCLPGAGGGDIVRIYYATLGNDGRRVEVVTIMLLDRLAGMFALVIWPLLVVPLFWHQVRASPTLAAVLATAAVVALAIPATMAIVWSGRVASCRGALAALFRLPGAPYLGRALKTLHAYRHARPVLARAVGISLLAHTLTVSAILLLAGTVTGTALNAGLMMVVPVGLLANALPVTPGGLGVGEAAFETLFRLVGLGGGAEVLLGWRLLMALLGLPGLVLYLQGRRRFVYTSPGLPSGRFSVLAAPSSPADSHPAHDLRLGAKGDGGRGDSRRATATQGESRGQASGSG